MAETRRREMAATDLRAAIAARLDRERQLKELADARAASEQAALQAANEKIQMERSLEATALSRVAAERDVAQLAGQRTLREAEAARAEAARREAEAQLRLAAAAAQQATDELSCFDHPTVLVDQDATEVAHEKAVPPRALPWWIATVAALVLAIALWWLGAEQFGATTAPTPPPPTPTPITTAIQELRLDTDVEAFGRRTATADSQDSSLRLVSPSATQ